MAITWHALLALFVVALALRWRPSQRTAALLTALPIVSVAATAWLAGNPFNGTVFVILAAILGFGIGRMSVERVTAAPPASAIMGGALIAFGFLYPHFLAAGNFVQYAYASPFGLLPCPTLLVMAGFTVLLDIAPRSLWTRALTLAALVYGLIGVAVLGVALDYVLLAGSVLLAWRDASNRITARQALLWCGIASSVLYMAMTVWIGAQFEGYDWTSQTISELSAIGAPTRTQWAIPGAIYTALVLAFGWGVWRAGFRSRALRVTGALLLAYGLLGLAWPFAPMHSREVIAAGGGTASDTMHLVLAGATVIVMFAAIASGATALSRSFRYFSVVTAVVLVLFGFATFQGAPGLASGVPTPGLGIWERINVGAFMLWMAIFAAALVSRRALRT